MKITINEKEIELKYSFRSMMIFENVTGGTFNTISLTDIITFFYCVVITSSKDYELNFDDFLEWLDENQEKMTEFSEWIIKQIKNQNILKKE